MAVDVAIIDGGGANIASLQFALQRLGVNGTLTREADRIRAASHVILPGVGAAADAMTRLRASGLDRLIPTLEQPVLGICLGLQLLAEHSEEEDTLCLGIVPGSVRRLAASPDFPVPNMGWCALDRQRHHPLMNGLGESAWCYFVHSYILEPGDFTLATAEHTQPFTAVLARHNFYATQFHPERSSRAGARLLANFLELPA